MAVLSAGGPENLCMAVFYLKPAGKARACLPEGLRVCEVMPRMTIGGLYAARYGRGESSVSEFAVLHAYSLWSGKKGFYVSHFYSDAKGGCEACEARFDWDIGKSSLAVAATSAGQPLISLRVRPFIFDIPIYANFPLLSQKGENVIFMQNQIIRNASISSSSVSIPEGSPLLDIKLGMKLISAFWDNSKILVREPDVSRGRIKAPDLGTPMGKST